jgi:hypothetical protein
MDTNRKTNYINLIQNIKIDQELKDTFINFIDSYDGTNHEDFKIMVMSLFLMLNKFAELELKATAMDAIIENNNEFKAQVEDLKKEYEQFKAGKPTIQKPHISLGN